NFISFKLANNHGEHGAHGENFWGRRDQPCPNQLPRVPRAPRGCIQTKVILDHVYYFCLGSRSISLCVCPHHRYHLSKNQRCIPASNAPIVPIPRPVAQRASVSRQLATRITFEPKMPPTSSVSRKAATQPNRNV